MDRPEPSESETKTILIRNPLQRQFVQDVSSETAVLVKYWRLRGAIVGSLRGLLGPFEGLLAPSWTVMSSSESESKKILIQSPLRSHFLKMSRAKRWF